MKFWILAITLIVSFGSTCGLIKKPDTQSGSGTTKTDSRNNTGFKKIKVENAIDVNVSVGRGFAITVTADDNVMPNVATEIQGDTLVVSLKSKVNAKSKINVDITMPEITDIDLVGAASCGVTGVKTDELNVSATGASRIKLDGTVKTLKAKAVGASVVDAEALRADKAEVESVGASNITVAASDDLKADATGASSVTYVGDPKQVKQNASDISTIKKK